MHLHEHSAEMPLILIADDERLMRIQLRRAMEQQGYRVIEATNGAECLSLYTQMQPNLVLLDALMPVMDGFTCCARLNALPGKFHAPVLMITGLGDRQSVDRAFAVGAADYTTKPIHWAVLYHRVQRLLEQVFLQRQQALLYQQLEAANQVLLHLAAIDGLTQIANRRRFDEFLEQTWHQMAQERSPLSLILCDVDYFKRYNDAFGHQAGDDCLRQIATAINHAVTHSSSLVARYGGEEFALIIARMTITEALEIAETIRVAIKALKLAHAPAQSQPWVSLSLGVATRIPHSDIEPFMLIAAADRALYEAKAAGRDRSAYDLC
jgi:diguanylate cyclase (GGDEF)-like protein